MSRRFSLLFSLSLLFLFFLSACTEDVQRTLQPTPSAFGQINSLVVIADSSTWEAGVGDSVAYFFEAPYILLPQPEPIFDVRFIEPERVEAEPTWGQLRNYVVLADLSDKDSPTTQMALQDLNDAKLQEIRDNGFGTAVAKNKWATGQQLIYVVGTTHDQLLTGLGQAHPGIVNRLQEGEDERLRVTTYFQGVNRRLSDTIRDELGVSLDVPGGYTRVPLNADDVVWLRREVQGASMNIMVTKAPYEDESQLSKEGLKAIRDRIGKEYVSSTIANTYMRINDEDLPLFTEATQLNGAFAIEGRGIWEIENDFLAGPFVSYLLNDTTNNQLVLVDGFVYAPGRKKRDLMSEIVQVLRTAEII
ncbi:hypothetical protein GGR26_002073 [Lewinella marina]|uniref:DUF4837 domain-containing protein n=1 Tax=Neolewinella marina TaxID=438751 RepID=A0A2G0CGW7_9BACT|nr:DUF4837 family protein [Neolewinella marina]NJB86305.1 hypothetical protein [Neolewinella marina]PHK99224.1 hypothetical protein CGL56_07135 [Neolewinella marina]